jgi:cellulose synthase/poly-beta-1,6-N-acetylglucosamine synthase-like glycosyltransferase
MPTAIRDVDLALPPVGLDRLDGAARCMLVVRWRGRVIGRTVVPVAGGRMSSEDVSRHVTAALDTDALATWVEEAIGFDERASPQQPRPSATVAICTHERPDDLARALGAVTSLSAPAHEILVVDNAPVTARTRSVVAQFPGVRYIVEPRKGLNVARNRALREATGDVVAFTDDDATPEPAWLEALRANFADRRVLCVTGLTLPLELETTAQELFEEHCTFARGFRRRVFDGRVDNPLAVAKVGAGANMAVRRTLATAVGPFDERLDAGTPTRSGGDHEMFARILLGGWRIVYEPWAVSWHRHRRSERELVATVRGYGTGVYAMWTGLLLERREFAVLRLAWRWFRYDHLPLLLSPARLLAPKGRDRLRRAELAGCLAGPAAWWVSRRRQAMT